MMKMTLRHNFAREIPTRGTVRFADPDQHGSGKGCGSPSLIASFFHLSSMQLLLRGKQPKKIFRPKKSDKWKLGHFIYRLRPKRALGFSSFVVALTISLPRAEDRPQRARSLANKGPMHIRNQPFTCYHSR